MTIFITGLLAGGITCLAVQGGLLATSIAQLDKEEEAGAHVNSVLAFLITRLVAYTLLGAVLGWVGTVAQLSLGVKVAMQVGVAIFMIGTALNLLQVHPIFRYFVIQPPRFLTRLVRNQAKSKKVFGPGLLGAFTVLIPCGATQAMMAYAITTGSGMSGAVTMGVFVLGTSPMFFGLGYLARKMGARMGGGFNKLAAAAIMIVAIYNINGALMLAGSPVSLPNILARETVVAEGGEVVDQATIFFTRSGYKTEPEVVKVKAGASLKLKLVNKEGAGCIQAFVIPKLGVQKTVRVGAEDQIEINIPAMSGKIAFMCSMGMYRGAINVI